MDLESVSGAAEWAGLLFRFLGGGETNQPRGCGGENVEIALYCDFRALGKGVKTYFRSSSLSMARHFHGRSRS